ncbi:glycosyltransferase family 4 protein [Paenibacillus sp. FJAT-27812]|uniref:glycosyltransferase family 4 protein n=1 Tax=Paenibacillus sp. FJAT-27812 TaxID=1684143 RepID=UPI0006A7EB6F|nr:glycosyltransferase family 4 protein [Paenibacillus sp. FJAT-27812]
MKIALVSYWSIPYTGGVSTYVLALRQGLEARGYEVDILSHNETGMNYHIVDKGKSIDKQAISVPIMQQIGTRFNEKSLNYDSWLAAMEGERIAFRQALSEFSLKKYDLIHAQDVISAIGASEVKSRTAPLIVTLHGKLAAEWKLQGAIFDHTRSWQWANGLDYYGSMVGDSIIFPSQWLRQQYESTGLMKDIQMDVIPYGIDTLSFIRKSASINSPSRQEGVKLLVCPARLDPVKGHEVLLEALALLLKQRSDWICWLIGDGPSHERLEQITKQYNLQQHVRFLGHRSDMASLLKEADIVVHPSIHDNLPFAIMEAQITGKPIIASEVGGIPEMIINGENGLLVPSGRADLLVDQIIGLFNDDALRKKMANKARYDGLRNWSLDKMIDRIVRLYDEAIRAKGGGGR